MANTLEFYLAKITSEHVDKPKFVAFVTAILQPLIDAQAALESLPLTFDLDYAVGVQLDAVGVRVGRSRYTSSPLGIYFSLDTVGLGLDEGVLFVPFDPTSGLTRLPDELYRTVLRAVILANEWDGTINGAYDIWNSIFYSQDNRIILIQDRWNEQSLYIVLAGNEPLPLYHDLFTMGKLLNTKPAGITLYYMVPSVYPGGPVSGGVPLFGLDAENETIGGLDSGAFVTVVGTE